MDFNSQLGHRRRQVHDPEKICVATPSDIPQHHSSRYPGRTTRGPLRELSVNELSRTPHQKRKRQHLPPHPLAESFNGAAEAYINEVASKAAESLDANYQKLVAAVGTEEIENKAGEALSALDEMAQCEADIEATTRSLDMVRVTGESAHGVEGHSEGTKSLGEIMRRFEQTSKAKMSELTRYLAEYDELEVEIAEVYQRLATVIMVDGDSGSTTNHSAMLLGKLRNDVERFTSQSISDLRDEQDRENRRTSRVNEAVIAALAQV